MDKTFYRCKSDRASRARMNRKTGRKERMKS